MDKITALWAKDGQEHSLSIKEWSELTGFGVATIRQRISTYHWTPEKAVNTSSHGGRLHTYRGEERTLPQIARENGMNIRTFVDRVRHGKSIEEAMGTPSSPKIWEWPVTIDGVTKTVRAWAIENHIDPYLAANRIGKHGKDPVEAVTRPPHKKKARK